MNTIKIENKEYVVVAKKHYEALLVKAASNAGPLRKRSLAEGKKLAYKLMINGQKSGNHP
jgi:hypothetical protein